MIMAWVQIILINRRTIAKFLIQLLQNSKVTHKMNNNYLVTIKAKIKKVSITQRVQFSHGMRMISISQKTSISTKISIKVEDILKTSFLNTR